MKYNFSVHLTNSTTSNKFALHHSIYLNSKKRVNNLCKIFVNLTVKKDLSFTCLMPNQRTQVKYTHI